MLIKTADWANGFVYNVCNNNYIKLIIYKRPLSQIERY